MRQHRRFILRDVTLGDATVGAATVDSWLDDAGVPRWSARLLMPSADTFDAGPLCGTTQDGQRLCGWVRLGGLHAAPSRGRQVLIELHGDGQLSTEPAEAARTPVEGAAPGLGAGAGSGPR